MIPPLEEDFFSRHGEKKFRTSSAAAAAPAPRRLRPRRRRSRTTHHGAMRVPFFTTAPAPTNTPSPTSTWPQTVLPGPRWTKSPSVESWSRLLRVLRTQCAATAAPGCTTQPAQISAPGPICALFATTADGCAKVAHTRCGRRSTTLLRASLSPTTAANAKAFGGVPATRLAAHFGAFVVHAFDGV